MHWLLFIHKIIFSSTCFEPQVLILRHPPKTFPLQSVLTQAVYRQATKNSHRQWQYHMLHVHNCILLKMSTWGSKYVEENIILWINNNQCIKLVINIKNCTVRLHIYTFVQNGRITLFMPIFWRSAQGRNKLCSAMLTEKKQHNAHCPNPIKITEIHVVDP